MKKTSVFYIDLDSKSREIFELDLDEVDADLDAMNASDYDRRHFHTFDEAEAFSELFESTLAGLSNEKICVSRDLKALLPYKRRYIVLSLLGLKNQTFRTYRRAVKKNELVNLHDQTYFLTVRIKNVTFDVSNQEYRYDFELP